ncbi:MAG: glycerophosphoryl diester phosphodiesterase membrane domain-containing protein [Ardenticatenaceae bacterium]|nr:glycerophosphoryl diester phosphodiesterase membrane domain-containing protein [Anaerolineales bacterium]MCB8937390.1 glycerophosphoryl diester phosphodiesterase membrane domain-containing protein [Ardenticatenaceae bacterium]MCB8975415.1 glycerophosphoryl diester phosphodiesterase membrane domain-containing protein [Ardenticatenaceae bacterium]
MNQNSPLDLRPLSIAELFDRSFRLYRKHFGTFLGIMLITQLPIYVFGIATATVENQAAVAGFAIIAAILTLVFTQIGAAALTKSISDSYLGRTITFRESFERIGGTWFTLIFASILAGLVVGGVIIPFYCMFTFLFTPLSRTSLVGPIILGVGFVIVGAIANVLISLIPPVVVLEKKGPMDSVKRAWEIAKKRFWWSLGYLFLLGILSLLVISGPVALIQFLFETVLGDTSLLFRTIVGDTASSLLSAIFMPIRLAAITLMYFDLRIRFEGFDLMVLSAASDAPLDDASDLTAQRNL